MEGFGCVLAGVFGSGTGMTSYSNNVAAIAVTKVCVCVCVCVRVCVQGRIPLEHSGVTRHVTTCRRRHVDDFPVYS